MVTEKNETQEGSYTLVVELSEDKVIDTGALGSVEYESGFYAYTGSAFGPGGFKRVDRHREVSRGENGTRMWHIDYLNGDTSSQIREVVKSEGREIECEIASFLSQEGFDYIEEFGCSDCDCDSHLFYSESFETLFEEVEDAHTSLG